MVSINTDYQLILKCENDLVCIVFTLFLEFNMTTIETPLYISSNTHQEKTDSICYNILHVADASSWYHRQPVNEDESILFELFGYEFDSLITKNMNVHIDDQIHVYMINKNYVINGGCQTNTHLMICKNFDFFDDLFKLNKKNLTMIDLINIQNKKNKNDVVNMLFMLNVSANDNILKYNIINYEMNLYKYLKGRFWLGDNFTNIKIYDIYENDVTKLLEEIYQKQINNISETPKKRKVDNIEY